MPRYYSVCETTASLIKRGTYRSRYYRVHESAPQGYLFHDSEQPLLFRHIIKAMYRLSSLYDESVRQVFAVRVDENTIMASFNLAGFPRPRAISGGEYLQKTQLVGWYLENIRDPSCDERFVHFNDLYDNCTQLERFVAKCPCPRLNEGTCFQDTLYTSIPTLKDNLINCQSPDLATYKRVKYQNIESFEYISGQLTVTDDFTESIRPWDNYDFKQVPHRKKEFSERGAESSRRIAHRKIACSQCTFSTRLHNGSYKDCGVIRRCAEPCSEEEAWTALYKWLDNSYFTKGTQGFTPRDIHYLIQMAGTEYPNKAVTKIRTTKSILAGFKQNYGHLVYNVVPTSGIMTRKVSFDNYDQLRTYFPNLIRREMIGEEYVLDRKMLLAAAIYSTWNYVRASNGHQPHAIYAVLYQSGSISLQGATGRNTFYAYGLSRASHVMEYVHALWPNDFPEIKQRSQLPVVV